jgi:hypothetical protein
MGNVAHSIVSSLFIRVFSVNLPAFTAALNGPFAACDDLRCIRRRAVMPANAGIQSNARPDGRFNCDAASNRLEAPTGAD